MADFSRSALTQQFVDNTKRLVLLLNSNLVSDYQNHFASFLAEKSQGITPNEPEPPFLQVVDDNKLAALFSSWDGSDLDLSKAISKVQMARYTAPVPPPAPPAQLGPQYEANKWAVVPGDISPLGTIIGVSGNQFIKAGTLTPFGVFGAHWEPK